LSKRLCTLILLLVLIVVMVGLSVSSVFAAFPDPSTYYQVINRNSGKMADVNGASTADLAKVIQWPWHGGNNQQWQFVDRGSGYYNLKNRNSGKCLDVTSVSSSDGALLIQYTCGSGNNQQFQLVAVGSYYQLRARHSGKCVSIVGNSTADGVQLEQRTCSNTNNSMQWTLTATGTMAPTPTPPPSGNQNPVLPGYYADPNAAIFGNTFYIYPTTDGIASWGATSFKTFSSTNLVDWTDRGVILDLANVSWCHANAWAPTIAYRNGTYYFYFSACQQIGVATSTSPTGPFTDALGRALVTTGQYGGQSIDPMVFIDDDGQAYMYFGQGSLNAVRLNANMTSFNGTPVNLAPSGYNEGTFVFKRNGTYYFMWSENDTRSEDYRVAYGRSSSPLGPITKVGVILSKNLSLGIKGTGHHSIIQTSSGAYYIVYHRFAIPNGDGTHRETCIDKLEFNADGTIKPVTVTLAGITSPVTP
jgi:hypothetical protein